MKRDYHTPVLLNEALGFLITDPNGIYVDGTLGGGGHAEGICKRLGEHGRVICFDADEDAMLFASERLRKFETKVTFVHANFRNLGSEMVRLNVRTINGLLLDLGVSSFQIDEEQKGFSFRSDERIDMRMDRRQTLSGWHVVNEYDEALLANVIWKYGEERNARRIARRIVEARTIDSTGELAATIEAAVGKKFLVKTLARVFQAIRIEVNDELRSLEKALDDAVGLLTAGGRCVVISYHSLEDRIVKRFFKAHSATILHSGHKLVPDVSVMPALKVLTKSPVEALPEEVMRNPRARSAKMRVAEKL